MSKAFTKDDDSAEPIPLPPRAPLPDGAPNYVTERGLRLLREELAALEADRRRIEAEIREAKERRAELARNAALAAAVSERLASAVLVPPPPAGAATIRFGARVRVATASGEETTYRIVGVDEASPDRGDIAFTSPIARALIGREEGDDVAVETPRGRQELSILEVGRGDETPLARE